MSTKTIPADVLNVLETKPARILVLPGEHHARTAGKKAVAVTNCEITFPSEEKLVACIEALRESDQQMKQLPPTR